LQVLDRLRRKYGRSEADILAFRDGVVRELAEIQGSDERRGELEEQLIALRGELSARAQTLSRGRRRAAKRLQRELEGALAELGMPSARIEVALEPMVPSEGVPCGPSGLEQPELRLGANPGEPTQPLRRTASGGELSRLFLALKNILRRAESGMVLVFDEVDAGIGGRAADRVGRLLAELASCHQVLCITHLPQIAALADTHLRVTKFEDRSRTVVQVVPLGEDARIEEIASMAGGERVTAGTRRHARELLGARATLRPGGSRRPRSTP
jgi:DNA repair protein RecN (Recombination protein N)